MRKTDASPKDLATIAPPHPLAELVITRLRERTNSRVLDFASGSGRNGAALRHAGFSVVSIDDPIAVSPAPVADLRGRFAAVVSTHGFLHGTTADIATRLALVAGQLEPEGLLCATFGSTKDVRYGKGERIDDFTFAPTHGDERGVAHAFFDRDRMLALLQLYFAIESLEERDVDDVAGSWAHARGSLAGALHWFAIAVLKAK